MTVNFRNVKCRQLRDDSPRFHQSVEVCDTNPQNKMTHKIQHGEKRRKNENQRG